MSTFIWVTLAGLATAVVGLVGGLLLLLYHRIRPATLHYFVSFAAGALLGVAFLDLLPEATEALSADTAGRYALLGLLLFFMAEKFLLWHHHGHPHQAGHLRAAAPLIIIGDTLHNFLDGIIIAVTFSASVPLGIATTLAIIMHEVPQELGDFAVLLDSGYRRGRIVAYNLVSGLATMVGAWLVLLVGPAITSSSDRLVAVAAGVFTYIAAADLIPQIHHEADRHRMLYQVICLVAGLGIMWAIVEFAH